MLKIQTESHAQLRDYLLQMIGLSNKEDLPRITQTLIGNKLNVDGSSISRFLNNSTATSPKALSNFVTKYPLEYQKWPPGQNTIGRILQVKDARLFLGIAQPNIPPQIAAPNNPLNILQDTQGNTQPTIPSAVPNRRAILPVASHKRSLKSLDYRKSMMTKAPIAISYRGHQSDKDGQGMLFDHMRVQDITRHETTVLASKDPKVEKATASLFLSALKNHTAKLPCSSPNQDMISSPLSVQDSSDLGLLVIPGRVRKVEDEPSRLSHEYSAIREALNRGQPILGLCAGSWRLFEQLVAWRNAPNHLNAGPKQLLSWHRENGTLVDAADHCYSRMISLNSGGVETAYNVDVHDIAIDPSSLLANGLRNQSNKATVNSVHWKAVNPNQMPSNTKVSAWAAKNPHINMKTRQSTLMSPEENTVEAFEGELGAPIMGIQWHPEGYGRNSIHGNLLRYMTAAGDAYAAKRKVLAELIRKVQLR